jgi:hypothetical protein
LNASSAICAVVVNWNGWRDTIVCVDSLLALGNPLLRIVLCDNASTDGSVSELTRYLSGRLPHWQKDPDGMGWVNPEFSDGALSVHLLRMPENLGYAGALNAGMRWSRDRWTPKGLWLLNNDTKAEPGALAALVTAHSSVPRAGICGSVLLEWDDPPRIQAVAGVHRRWLGVGWHDKKLPAEGGDVTLVLDYPVGASMYVSAEYVDAVGLLDEAYFLYNEEIDWVERGRRLGYRPLVALRSCLRHKEGASTGSRGGVRNKSLVSEYYGAINRLRVTWKFWPYFWPVTWLSLLLVALDRLVHREWTRAWLVLRLMFWPKPKKGAGSR